MVRANLQLSAELERTFADAQSGKVRSVKIAFEDEAFMLADIGHTTQSQLEPENAAFVLEGVRVRDKMLY